MTNEYIDSKPRNSQVGSARKSLKQPEYERTTRRPAKANQNETEKICKICKICKMWIENSNSAKHKRRRADDSTGFERERERERADLLHEGEG